MSNSITKAQVEEINEKYFYESQEAGYALLKDYTGIEARPYTAYLFYDEAGNYVGDSEKDDFEEIILNAYIKII